MDYRNVVKFIVGIEYINPEQQEMDRILAKVVNVGSMSPFQKSELLIEVVSNELIMDFMRKTHPEVLECAVDIINKLIKETEELEEQGIPCLANRRKK